MPLTPAQIKDKLINALDDDKNVIDEKAVEEVLELLETSAITKEILEQTRLGKDVNLVRKISKNPETAKRARNLVKAWKKFITVPGTPSLANGQYPTHVSSPITSTVPCQSTTSFVSERHHLGQSFLGSRSPIVQAVTACSSLSSPKLAQQEVNSVPVDMVLSLKPFVGAHHSHLKTASPLFGSSSPQIPAQASHIREKRNHHLSDKRNSFHALSDKNSNAKANRHNVGLGIKPPAKSSNAESNSERHASHHRDVSKTDVANRKRTRHLEKSNPSLQSPLLEQPNLVSLSLSTSDVINTSVLRRAKVTEPVINLEQSVISSSVVGHKGHNSYSSKNVVQDLPLSTSVKCRVNQIPEPLRQDKDLECKGHRKRLSKVKTTDELFEDVQRKSSLSLGSHKDHMVKNSQANIVHCDKDKIKKKRKAKQTHTVQDFETSRLPSTKSEHHEKLLQPSAVSSGNEGNSKQSNSFLSQESVSAQPDVLNDSYHSISNEDRFKCESSYRQDGPYSYSSNVAAVSDNALPVLKRLSEDQILASLPRLDFDNIDWGIHDYTPSWPIQVTDELIDQLHLGRLEGINGTYDCFDQFRHWQEMLTFDTAYDEQLHILPYVILDI